MFSFRLSQEFQDIGQPRHRAIWGLHGTESFQIGPVTVGDLLFDLEASSQTFILRVVSFISWFKRSLAHVRQHHLAISAEMHVEFERMRPRLDGAIDRTECILWKSSLVSPMGDNLGELRGVASSGRGLRRC